MCMKGEADTCGREKGPCARRRRKPERMRSTKNKKKDVNKKRIELTTFGCWKRGKPVLTLTACASAFRT